MAIKKKYEADIFVSFSYFFFGADERTRTADLILTKDALYLLSYTSVI